MKKANSIFWGLALVAVGVFLGLNAFGITDFNIFFDGWWTLFIIVPCTIGLFTDYDKTGNLIGILIGLVLLLCCQGFWDFDMIRKLLIPAVIVLIGLKLVFGNIFGNKGRQMLHRLESGDGSVHSAAATFSGSNLDYTGQVFEGARLDAVFGGIKCDLRGAIINSDCVIDASAVFGGIDIYVPDGINVKVTSNSIFGGVSGRDRRNDPNARHTLYINAMCLFGGVEIK